MSATIDASLFSNYFNQCKIVEIEGFTFPVQNIYLEDILKVSDYNPESRKFSSDKLDQCDEMDEESSKKVNQIENAENFKIEYGLIASIVNQICKAEIKGGILIFVSGVMEIKRAIDRIKEDISSNVLNRIKLIPLHSNLTSSEQQDVFKRVDLRKVVVSTNIAGKFIFKNLKRQALLLMILYSSLILDA
jgi:HrpA-like RNA helicase